MRVLSAVNRVCYASSLISVVVGAFLAIFAIWTEAEDVAWKGVTTTVVVLFASVLIMVINGVLGVRVVSDDLEFTLPTGKPRADRVPSGPRDDASS